MRIPIPLYLLAFSLLTLPFLTPAGTGIDQERPDVPYNPDPFQENNMVEKREPTFTFTIFDDEKNGTASAALEVSCFPFYLLNRTQ